MTIDRISETSSSGYSSLDDNKEIQSIHLDREVCKSNKGEAIFNESSSAHPCSQPHSNSGKSIDKFSINSLGSNDSGQHPVTSQKRPADLTEDPLHPSKSAKKISKIEVFPVKYEQLQHSLPENLKLTKVLGQGGYGKVCLVETDDTADKYALKLLFNNKDIKKELNNINKVGQHPNIVSVFGVADVGGDQGILMEYIPGIPLSDLLSELTRFYLDCSLSHADFWGAIQYILKEMLSGVNHIQEQGYAHHDLTPQNILVHKERLIPIIIDFGNLQHFGERGMVGSEFYETPEFCASRFTAAVSDKFDTYSVGQIIYSLFSKIISPELGGFFTAGVKYKDLIASERMILLYRLNSAMNEYQTLNDSGEFKRALQPITREELESRVQAVFQDSKKLTGVLERFYERSGNENIPLDVVLEKELEKNLMREHMIGHYGCESSLINFINLMLHPDPNYRPNAAEALKQPFLADPLYKDEESAKAVIKRVLEKS